MMNIYEREREATRGPPTMPRDTSGDVGSLSSSRGEFESRTGYWQYLIAMRV